MEPERDPDPERPEPGEESSDRARDPRDDDADREHPYELLQRATSLMRGRHHAQAAVVLERAAKLEPGKGSILEALGRAYYNSGQHERSRQAFEALLEVDPSADYAHFGLGQSLKQLGRRHEAYTHLRMAVALHPANQLYQGALDRFGGRPDDAPTDRAPDAAAAPDDPPAAPDDEEPGA